MDFVLQMNLKIVHTRFRTRRVQLARTVFTPYPWIIHELHIFWSGGIGADGDGEVSNGGDGSVAHITFEGVVRIVVLEACEGDCKPAGGFGLNEGSLLVEFKSLRKVEYCLLSQ